MAYPKFSSIAIGQYLKIEEEDRYRYEYHEGHLYKRSGGSIRHETIIDNVNGTIKAALKLNTSKCRTFGSGLKIELQEGIRYVYADGSVLCKTPDESTAVSGAVKNPVVVIEVLSKSTAAYDRGLKGEWYRALPSIREYVLITQSRPSVSLYSRKDRFTLYNYRDILGIDAVLNLESIGVSIPLSIIYEDVEFDKEDLDPTTPRKLYDPIKPYGQPAE